MTDMAHPTPSQAEPAGLDPAARDAFLSHFPANKKGTIANLFLSPIRRRVIVPGLVVEAVVHELYQRLENPAPWASEAYLDDAAHASQVIQDHRLEAIAFAQYYIEYEQLPYTERQALKAQRGDEHRAAWMAAQPPTEKQLGYLRKLGYAGPAPASKADASAEIDRLLARRAVRDAR
jgi:hypothetical protein